MGPSSKLTRNYSIASLIGIVAIGIVLGIFYRAMVVGALQDTETEANVSLSQALANGIWPKYGEFIATAGRLPAGELARRPEIAALHREVLDKMRGLRVVKVKIYDREGQTVFSTDHRQIGEDQASNEGFQNARRGATASLIVFRHQFDTREQVIADRSLLQTYIPFRHDPGGPIDGVFELYTDVTLLLAEAERTGYIVIGVLTLAMLVLYMFLLTVIRQADQLLAKEARERQVQQARIQQLAYYDSLTGLPNRPTFLDLLRRAIERAKRSRNLLGLMFIDIDRFKDINDKLGHGAGDHVLAEAAHRLSACTRNVDTVCRIGGDEFTIILENLQTAETACAVAARILKCFGDAVAIENDSVEVTVSIGIALAPAGARDPEQLVKDADAAMYQAKALGRNRYAFYTEAPQPQSALPLLA